MHSFQASARQGRLIKLRVCLIKTQKLSSIRSSVLPQPKRRLPIWIWPPVTVSQSILVCPLPVLMTICLRNRQLAVSLNQFTQLLRKVLGIQYLMEVLIRMMTSSMFIWNKCRRLSWGKLRNAKLIRRMNTYQISISRKILCEKTWSKCWKKKTLGELESWILLVLSERLLLSKLRLNKRRKGSSRAKRLSSSISFLSLNNLISLSWSRLRSTMTKKSCLNLWALRNSWRPYRCSTTSKPLSLRIEYWRTTKK